MEQEKQRIHINLTVNDGNVSIVELSGTEILSGELDPLGENEYYEIEYIVEETGVNPDASTTTKITGSNKAKVTTKDYPYGKKINLHLRLNGSVISWYQELIKKVSMMENPKLIGRLL